MPYKEFSLDDDRIVKIYKRRGSKSLRLSITSTGQIRVTMPFWASYRAGLQFAKSKTAWINEHHQEKDLLENNMLVGKAHRLVFNPDSSRQKVSTRIRDNQVTITYPASNSVTDDGIQSAAAKASIKALNLQSNQLLPQRLKTLAEQHDFSYKSVKVRQLKSRWGSCDTKGNIVLNIYLMQLPWDLIDYVLLHELVHTKIHRHGPDFWKMLETKLPNAKVLKKRLREHQPILRSMHTMSVA
ncbi:MAG: M48 family metallopeptidase [Candidatus Saccharimonadales bacterium]